MDLIDLLIIVLLAAAYIRGKEIGSIRQVFSTVGFLLGLLIGSALSPFFVNFGQTAISRSLLTFVIMLSAALIFLSLFEFMGALVKQKLAHNMLDILDRGIGSLMSIVTVLAVVWLGATVLIKLPYTGLQDEIRNSAIISSITHILPPAPRLISDLGHLINPNAFPQVFTTKEPSPQTATLPDLGTLQTAVAKDEASVVKVEGKGCGGVVEGSGFVAGDHLVATNAHVIAGVNGPYVLDKNGKHATSPVLFDPDLDFAVLRVNELSGTPLAISHETVASGTPSAVLGYPGGGNFDAQPASVLDKFNATGRNIYDQNQTTREVYEISATVVPGNSGGPLIDQNGTVIGVVFAQSTTYNNIGYTLTSPSVLHELAQAAGQQQAVATGTCAE